MRRLDERQRVNDAIKSFRASYGDGTYASDKRGIAVGAELAKLDPKVATAKEVAELIGNDSWVKQKSCGECGKETWNIVEIGEEPDYESRTAYICGDCLEEGARLARGNSSNAEVTGAPIGSANKGEKA